MSKGKVSKAPVLTYHDERHEYAINGEVIPSVTQVMTPSFYCTPEQLERAGQVGTAVHDAIAMSLDGTLDEESLHPEIAGYLKSFRQLPMEQGHMYEWKHGSPSPWHKLQLAAYYWLWREGARVEPASNHYVEVRLIHVTARFGGTIDYCTARQGLAPEKCHLVYLQKDGSMPSIVTIKDIGDLTYFRMVFTSFLTAFNWKKREGLL